MRLLTFIATRIGAIPWLPRFLPQIVAIDRLIQRLSRGRLSLLDLAGLPNATLTVVGRKSGLPRSTPLLCVPHDGTWLIAGSYFGDHRVPQWVGNLRAAGRAQIEFAGEHVEVTAHEAEGAERQHLWEALLDTWPNFTLYEQRTSRVIPVFQLRRR